MQTISYTSPLFYTGSTARFTAYQLRDGSTLIFQPGQTSDKSLVIRISANGDVWWSKEITLNGFINTGYMLHEMKNGDLLLEGYGTPASNNTGVGLLMIMLDAGGNFLWQKNYSDGDGFFTSSWAVDDAADGSIIQAFASGDGFAILCFDNRGNFAWGNLYRSFVTGDLFAGQPKLFVINGSIFVTGGTDGDTTSGRLPAVWMVEFDKMTGRVIKSKTWEITCQVPDAGAYFDIMPPFATLFDGDKFKLSFNLSGYRLRQNQTVFISLDTNFTIINNPVAVTPKAGTSTNMALQEATNKNGYSVYTLNNYNNGGLGYYAVIDVRGNIVQQRTLPSLGSTAANLLLDDENKICIVTAINGDTPGSLQFVLSKSFIGENTGGPCSGVNVNALASAGVTCNPANYLFSLVQAVIPDPDTKEMPVVGITGFAVQKGLATCTRFSACDPIKITGKQAYCLGDSTALFTTHKNTGCYKSVEWQTNADIAGVNQVDDTTVTVKFKNAGTAYLYARLPGCGLSDSILLNISPSALSVSLGPDTSICPGSVYKLSAQGNYAGYTWQDGSTKNYYNVNKPGKYYVTVTGNCSSMASDTVVVTAESLSPAVSLGADTALCSGQQLLLKPLFNYTEYVWQDGSGEDHFNALQAGKYYLTATGNCGIKTSDTIVVTNIPAAPISLGNDTSLCPGTVLMLQPAYNYKHYTWQDGSQLNRYTVSSPGSYYVAATDACKNIVSDTINIFYRNALPQAYLGHDTTVCKGTMVALSPGPGYASYRWQNGSTGDTFSATGAGSYSVTVTDSCGNTSTASINIFENNIPPVSLGTDTLLCPNTAYSLKPGGNYTTYLWQDGSSGKTFIVTQPGLYAVTVSDDCGNQVSDTVNIAYDNSILSAGPDISICAGNDTVIHASTGFTNYYWTPANSVTTLAPGIVKVQPLQQTAYTVSATSAAGCNYKDTVVVGIKDCGNSFFMPTAFTPNRDMVNDIIKPVITGRVTRYEFVIYNQWGQKMFSSSQAGNGWNGTLGGKLQGVGSYVWYCRIQFQGTAGELKKGVFVLIR